MCVVWSYLDADLVYSGGEDGTVRPWRPSRQQNRQPPVPGTLRIKTELNARPTVRLIYTEREYYNDSLRMLSSWRPVCRKSQKGELNRKNKQRSKKYQGEKTAKDYFLELSTPWMPGTGHTEDISRPSDRVKNSTEKKARKLCITYLKTKKNRRLEFQRLNYSLSIAHFSVSGSSNSNLIAHLLGNLS